MNEYDRQVEEALIQAEFLIREARNEHASFLRKVRDAVRPIYDQHNAVRQRFGVGDEGEDFNVRISLTGPQLRLLRDIFAIAGSDPTPLGVPGQPVGDTLEDLL